MHFSQSKSTKCEIFAWNCDFFEEPLITETWNLWHWIWHASNPTYVLLKPFQSQFFYASQTSLAKSAIENVKIFFPSQNQQNVIFFTVSWTPPDKKLKKNINFHKEKVFTKTCKSAHIGFWVCQLQCTLLQLCVTSTFWIIMVFLHLLWEGQDIGFWNMV